MNLLKQRINDFNENPEIEFQKLEISVPATSAELEEIQNYFELPMPKELQDFYQQFGGILSEDEELNCIKIQSTAKLLYDLMQENKWQKCHSLGLIDFIKYSWGNDRHEFEDPDLIKKSEIDYFNENYKCFGLYRYDWGFEEAYYLYFDKNQQFGWVRYHQDEFDYLREEHLDGMLKESPANQGLENLLISVIDQVETNVLEEDN